MLQRFPVIVGPTAGGKSALAIELADALRTRTDTHAEIVSADSMQVYREMDIGTAKPTPEERARIPHHLIDILDPAEPFSVDRWLSLAERCIGELREGGVLPIVVGGTHLYAKALLEGLFPSPEPDPGIRARLAGMDPRARRELLERVDPAAAARIHPNDVRRTVRALEVWETTGTPISELQRQWDAGRVRPDALLVGLEWPAETLSRRINARVKDMMARGFLDEVRALHEAGRIGPNAAQALGYRQLIDHLEGRLTLDEAVERIKIETRRFAKNQRTWLRRLRTLPDALWLDAEGACAPDLAQIIVHHILTQHGPRPSSPPDPGGFGERCGGADRHSPDRRA